MVIRDDQHFVMGEAVEQTAHNARRRLGCLLEESLELVLGLGAQLIMMQGGIVEDHADATLLGQREQDFENVRGVEVVGKHVQLEFLVFQHLIEDGENLVLGREPQPIVLLREGVILTRAVLARHLLGIEKQFLALWPEDGLGAEMMHEGL